MQPNIIEIIPKYNSRDYMYFLFSKKTKDYAIFLLYLI